MKKRAGRTYPKPTAPCQKAACMAAHTVGALAFTVFFCALFLLAGCQGAGKAGQGTAAVEQGAGKAGQAKAAGKNSVESGEGRKKAQGGKEVQKPEGQGAQAQEETVTLDVYSQLSGFSGEQEGWFAKLMLEKFHVKLNFIYDGTEDFYEQKEREGNLGDIVVFGTDSDQYHSAIEKGLLLDWEQDGLLETYGPYIQGHMAKALEKNRRNSGGHIYGFGYDVAAAGGEFGDFDYHPDIRWDLYQQVGSPKVTELEDYVGVLRQMKEICPVSDTGEETYGVSLFPDWDGDMMMFAKSTCTNFFGVDELGIGLYCAADGSFQGCLEEGGYYLRALHFYHELYKNGLLAPDSRTQGQESCLEDYKNGRAFFCIFGWMAAPLYNTVNHTADGKIMLPLAAKNQNTLVYGLNENGGNRLWAIGAKCRNPQLAMAILDWMCTPEGRLTTEYGPKGVCWDYDLEGNSCMMDLGYRAQTGEDVTMPEGSGYEGTWAEGVPQFNNTTWTLNTVNEASNGQTFNYQYWPNVMEREASAVEQSWREENQVNSIREYLSGFAYTVSKPNSYTASPKPEELGEQWAKVTEIIREGSWDAIYAKTEEEFQQKVSAMQAAAMANGYGDCLAWCEQEARKRKASEE